MVGRTDAAPAGHFTVQSSVIYRFGGSGPLLGRFLSGGSSKVRGMILTSLVLPEEIMK